MLCLIFLASGWRKCIIGHKQGRTISFSPMCVFQLVLWGHAQEGTEGAKCIIGQKQGSTISFSPLYVFKVGLPKKMEKPSLMAYNHNCIRNILKKLIQVYFVKLKLIWSSRKLTSTGNKKFVLIYPIWAVSWIQQISNTMISLSYFFVVLIWL